MKPKLKYTSVKQNMSATQNHEPEYDASDDEEMAAFLCASHLAAGFAMPMTLKAVIELGVLDIIANAGPGRQLSPAEIVSEIETENPTAPVVLDRLLRYLASGSVLTCSVAEGDGSRPERRYGLGPVCKFFISRADGASLAPFILMNQAKIHQACWQELKYAVIDGVTPFQKIAGMNQFDYMQRDPELRKIFNDAMSGGSVISLRMILGSYTGFQSIGTLVDVGGGTGTALQTIIFKFPTIKGINFDLPHIISDAPSISGVEHIGGDMFACIPSGDAILMKWILHDWNDEDCLKILKNCYNALPDSGKVIIMEFTLTEVPYEDPFTQMMLVGDLCMLNYIGGKERTEREFESLAREAGFAEFKVVPCNFGTPVIELLK